MKPRCLDLFCGGGGAGHGYALAGFDVTGVDNRPMPRYPYRFILADALEYVAAHGHEFDFIHASPPCHDHTPLRALTGLDGTGRLLPETRAALVAAGKPYAIENVPGAPLNYYVTLCGGMFGLRTYRHRRFETSWLMFQPHHPPHMIRTSTKKRRKDWDAGLHVSVTGDVGTYVGLEALGIDWMTGNELSQAIPPAYTRFIGASWLAMQERGAA